MMDMMCFWVGTVPAMSFAPGIIITNYYQSFLTDEDLTSVAVLTAGTTFPDDLESFIQTSEPCFVSTENAEIEVIDNANIRINAFMVSPMVLYRYMLHSWCQV